jgi:nicotinamide-nucleotide amidase
MPACDNILTNLSATLLREAECQKLEIITVESCTGGLLASMLTNVEGLSHVFNRAMITYCDAAKIEMVAVPVKLLHEYGAVSAAVAQAMASGGRRSVGGSNCLSLAVTGYAGPPPDGGPSGLVYVAASTPTCIRVERYDFDSDDRDVVRQKAILAALELGIEILR